MATSFMQLIALIAPIFVVVAHASSGYRASLDKYAFPQAAKIRAQLSDSHHLFQSAPTSAEDSCTYRTRTVRCNRTYKADSPYDFPNPLVDVATPDRLVHALEVAPEGRIVGIGVPLVSREDLRSSTDNPDFVPGEGAWANSLLWLPITEIEGASALLREYERAAAKGSLFSCSNYCGFIAPLADELRQKGEFVLCVAAAGAPQVTPPAACVPLVLKAQGKTWIACVSTIDALAGYGGGPMDFSDLSDALPVGIALRDVKNEISRELGRRPLLLRVSRLPSGLLLGRSEKGRDSPVLPGWYEDVAAHVYVNHPTEEDMPLEEGKDPHLDTSRIVINFNIYVWISAIKHTDRERNWNPASGWMIQRYRTILSTAIDAAVNRICKQRKIDAEKKSLCNRDGT